MSTYIELTPSTITLTDSITGSLKNIKLHDGHLWIETTDGTYIQLLDNYIQDIEANKPAAGTQGRWFYATDSNKLYYDNGTAWQEILNKIIYCMQDTEANKPAAGTQGRWFYATDTNILYYDDGSNWRLIGLTFLDMPVSSACDYVEWTGLDINTDKLYTIIGKVKNATANTMHLACYYEADYTDTDYYAERLAVANTHVTSSNLNGGEISALLSHKNGIFKAKIQLTSDGYCICISQSGSGSGSNNVIDIYTQNLTVTQTNITQIRLTSDQAGGIGANSWFRLIRGN